MKTIIEVLKDVESRSDNLIRKLVVWDSPIDNGSFEYRVAYFSDNAEALDWEIYMKEKYKKLGIKIRVYTSVHSAQI